MFISHSLPFAQKYADRAGVMHEGKIVKEARLKDVATLERFLRVL